LSGAKAGKPAPEVALLDTGDTVGQFTAR
jgi:hypothetical protein